MTKTTNEKQNEPGASDEKVPPTKLPLLEMYAVLGLELGKRIFEKLESVEKSIEILAAQKARELNPEERSDAADN